MASPLIPVQRARELVLAACAPLPEEPVHIGEALDRVLARDVVAQADVPRFDNSAMDGFAVRADASSGRLAVAGEARAGTPSPVPLAAGAAIRISTGAALPAGADAVAPVEDVQEADGAVTLAAPVRPGQHVRHAGEDLRAGAVALAAGTTLGPAELSIAVVAGAATVACARRPRVAILCTGDELRAPGTPLGPGEIHDSNRVALAALAARAGADVVAAGTVHDEATATRAAFARALEGADVVIASGGVSVGPHDHVKAALRALGVEERFWRVDLQPGKPTWFGTRGAQLAFGLPGNPVSAFVTFLLFARPALRALQGAPPLAERAEAALTEDVPRRGREQALRVRLSLRDGVLHATPTGPQGSHVTASLRGADALAFVPAGEGAVAAGEHVAIERI